MSQLTQVKKNNNQTFQTSGVLGGAYSYITWVGAVTDNIGQSYSGQYTAYYGSIADEADLFAGTVWTNAALLALGAPYLTRSLANWTGSYPYSAVDTISYTFSSPVPAGMSFLLWDPGANYQGNNGPYTFQITASNQGTPVSTAGWSFQIETPNNEAPGSNLTVNAAAGAIIVNSYAQTAYPDTVVVITPNTPITSISITAHTLAYDLWGFALPNLPSQIVFEQLGPGQADGTLVAWNVNDTKILGGGAIGDPGPAWTYEGRADFFGTGESDVLWLNQNGDLWIWRVSGTSATASVRIGKPGGTWKVIGTGDAYGAGTSDIFFLDANGDIAVWEMSGASIVAGGTIGKLGPGWTFKGVGDFNGDGKSDLLFENSSGVYATWLLNGATISGGATLGALGLNWAFKGIGDFDGSGVSDVLFENTVQRPIRDLGHQERRDLRRRRHRHAGRAMGVQGRRQLHDGGDQRHPVQELPHRRLCDLGPQRHEHRRRRNPRQSRPELRDSQPPAGRPPRVAADHRVSGWRGQYRDLERRAFDQPRRRQFRQPGRRLDDAGRRGFLWKFAARLPVSQ